MFLGVSDTAFSVFSLLFNLPILHELLMFSPILVCPDFVYPDFYAARNCFSSSRQVLPTHPEIWSGTIF